jgi:hypothetical protein
VFGQNRSDDHLGQIKDCKIGICYFSAKYAALRRNSKDRFPPNRDNMFKRQPEYCCFSDLAI